MLRTLYIRISHRDPKTHHQAQAWYPLFRVDDDTIQRILHDDPLQPSLSYTINVQPIADDQQNKHILNQLINYNQKHNQ